MLTIHIKKQIPSIIYPNSYEAYWYGNASEKVKIKAEMISIEISLNNSRLLTAWSLNGLTLA